MLCEKLTRGCYRNALVARNFQQMLIPANDDLRAAFNRRSDKHVVVRIFTDSFRHRARRAHLRMHNDKIENALNIYAGEFFCKLC